MRATGVHVEVIEVSRRSGASESNSATRPEFAGAAASDARDLDAIGYFPSSPS